MSCAAMALEEFQSHGPAQNSTKSATRSDGEYPLSADARQTAA